MIGQSPQSLIFILVVFCFTMEDNWVAGYSMLLTTPSGTFQSPGYPDADDDWTWTWKISMPLNTKIEVIFDDFDLLDIFCCTDMLEVWDNEENLGIFTGNNLNGKTITSLGNEVTVVLKTCSSSLFFDRRGIKVSYTSSFPTTMERLSTSAITKKHLPKYVLGVSLAGVIITVVIISAVISAKKKHGTLLRSQQNDRSSDDCGIYVTTVTDISKYSQGSSSLGRYERNILYVGSEENNENTDYQVVDCKV